MAKRNTLSPTGLMLMFFVFLFPFFMSGFDKKAVIYASLSLSLVFLCYEMIKKSRLVITKPFLLMVLISIYSFVSLSYISDKGSHFALSSFLLLCTVVILLSSSVKEEVGEEIFVKNGVEIVYKGAVVFSVCAFLWQVFIDSKFVSNLDFGNGSKTASGIIFLAGIWAGIKLYRTKKRNVSFFIFMAFMLYGFVMTRSLLCYLMAGILLLCTALNMRHKKVEALMALIFSVVLGVVNLVYAVAMMVTGAVEYKGALFGLSNIFGVGSGGYNAVMAVLDGEINSTPSTFLYLTECFGVVGIIAILLCLFAGFVVWNHKRSFLSLFSFMTMIVMLISDVNAFFVLLPLVCLYYGTTARAITIKVKNYIGIIPLMLVFLFALSAFARLPFSMGENAYETGKYENGEEYFSTAAGMSLFDSEGWEKAYECVFAQSEDGGENTSAQIKYLGRAGDFNKANYKYSKLIADAYSREGTHENALTTWEYIIANCDNEYLYPEYAQKIMDVMAISADTARVEELYNRIAFYADKTVDKDIKFEVNNILAKSQVYYIESRENGGVLSDMYQDGTLIPEEN